MLSDDELRDEILRREPVHGIRIVGVDGPSGGGKSLLARRLAELTSAPVVEIDDFVSWDDFAGWWPRFDEQVLTPLLAGRDARYQVRDWARDWRGGSLGSWKTLPWHPLVILEGVTCTRRETVGRLAYAIWVEADPAVRLARGLARDGAEHRDLWERWMREEAAFFAADGARERADLRVDTSER
ncbi:uridine kinase family protein [Micromonospora inositola]|uniref:uridine kinase family protein n=1 Tax=Micromonospora inositola TaxID=47865 RepID=UPI001560E905